MTSLTCETKKICQKLTPKQAHIFLNGKGPPLELKN